jgi:hypothetical protein
MTTEYSYDREPDVDDDFDWVTFDQIVPEMDRPAAEAQLLIDYDEPIEVRWAGLTVAKVIYL